MDTLNQINKENDSTLFSKELYNNQHADGMEFHYWNVARFKIIFEYIKNIDIPINDRKLRSQKENKIR